MQPPALKARRSLTHAQVGLILAGKGNKGTQRTLQLEECSVASPLMSHVATRPLWQSCGATGASYMWYVGQRALHVDMSYTLDMINIKDKA